MREMVLNHASILAPGSDPESVTQWLKDLVRGMATLVNKQVVQGSLRMARELHETQCLPGYSLSDAYQHLRAQGQSYRDDYVFLMKLDAKYPLLREVGEEVRGRFLACEHRSLPEPEGEPLVFSAIADAIVIGFPSSPEWDRDRVTVHFNELLPDATIKPASEDVDQLTRYAHAAPICDRHRAFLLAGINPHALWENRGVAFPNLVFGPGVQQDLERFAHLLSTIVGKLTALDVAARDWHSRGGPVPDWGTKVSRESERVMNNPRLREERRFRSDAGIRKLFEWHARFGDNGRIHLRLDQSEHIVEIGYIGRHLPL